MSTIQIKKIKIAGVPVYPATILDAVKDATAKITVNGESIDNPNYGKTVREIIGANTTSIENLDTSIGVLTSLKTTEKETIVGAINELKTSLGSIASDETVKSNTDAITKLNGDDKTEGSVAYAVAQAKKDLIGTSATQATGTSETLTSLDDRLDTIETTLNVAGTDKDTIDKVDEVLTWFSGIKETDAQGAAIITAAAAVGTKGDSTTASTGLIKDVEDLKAVGATKVTVSATDGVTDADGNTYKYEAPEGTVVDEDYEHITVSATDGVTAGKVTYKYTPEEGTVVDTAYKHVTITSTSVSDGTNTLSVPDVEVKTTSANYLGAESHTIEAKTSDIAAEATGLATAANVYSYAITADAATDTTEYADVF